MPSEYDRANNSARGRLRARIELIKGRPRSNYPRWTRLDIRDVEILMRTIQGLQTKENGYMLELNEVEQRLGRALGYPRFCDDQKNFPGSTDADGVCVGEHVAGTIAHEAADRIEVMRAALEKLADPQNYVAMAAPMFVCGDVQAYEIAREALGNDAHGFIKLLTDTLLASQIELWDRVNHDEPIMMGIVCGYCRRSVKTLGQPDIPHDKDCRVAPVLEMLSAPAPEGV